MRVTNKYLANAYKDFNKRYFGNKLPKDMVVRFVRMNDALGITRTHWGRAAFIIVSHRLSFSACLASMTLLHEMVHVKFPTLEHGPTFHKEMLRLAKAGAFKDWW